jgi:hypothetical protein
VYTRVLKQKALEKRLFNINSFSEISRIGLEFNVAECKLLLHETSQGEKIYIQYPGKETKSNDSTRIRPWDFRPKLQQSDGKFMKDLSFADVWDDLSEIHIADNEVLAVLATVFFRMSLMMDYVKIKDQYNCNVFDMQDNSYSPGLTVELEWYKFAPDKELLLYLEEKIGKIRGVSVESYLYYNDLLVQNEDCKYYYKDSEVNGVDWNNKVGRNNTLLTHLSLIGYLQGHIKFSDIMNRFIRGRGVAPITFNMIPTITNGLVKK